MMLTHLVNYLSIIFHYKEIGLIFLISASLTLTPQRENRVFLRKHERGSNLERKPMEGRRSQKHPTKQEVEQNSRKEILKLNGFTLTIKQQNKSEKNKVEGQEKSQYTFRYWNKERPCSFQRGNLAKVKNLTLNLMFWTSRKILFPGMSALTPCTRLPVLCFYLANPPKPVPSESDDELIFLAVVSEPDAVPPDEYIRAHKEQKWYITVDKSLPEVPSISEESITESSVIRENSTSSTYLASTLVNIHNDPITSFVGDNYAVLEHNWEKQINFWPWDHNWCTRNNWWWVSEWHTDLPTWWVPSKPSSHCLK